MSYNSTVKGPATSWLQDLDKGYSAARELELGWLNSFRGKSAFSLLDSVTTYLLGNKIEFTVLESRVTFKIAVKGQTWYLYPSLAELIDIRGFEYGSVTGTEEILEFLRGC